MLYIKVAIVILGGFFAVTAAGKLSLASSLVLRGLAAIAEAYLIYWAVVYYVARKWFGFSREWSAPLASGISICGVSAAIATGGAIRARPLVPVLVSSLVVVFAVTEVLVLPFVSGALLAHEPLVAGAWMGLAVKTDGAAVAAGGIAESLILAKNAAEACAISRAGSSAPPRPSRYSSTSSSASGPSCSAISGPITSTSRPIRTRRRPGKSGNAFRSSSSASW
jgi:uncharacterized membrane protein YadS